MARFYGEISKRESLDDGTCRVWGYASTDQADSVGDVVTADAMRAALPAYMEWANIREMHQPMAAGYAMEASVLDDGRTWIGCHIVDLQAAQKVITGVYKGFSIHGKKTKVNARDRRIIEGLEIDEISLVDRPMNKGATFQTICKIGGDTMARTAEQEAAVTELAELMNAGTADPVAILAIAKNSNEVSKAGSRFSAATKGALKKAHEACKMADTALSELAYESDEEAEKMNETKTGDVVAKSAFTDTPETLAKLSQVQIELESAKKLATEATNLASELSKGAALHAAEKLALNERIAKLEAVPLPAKGSLLDVSKARGDVAESMEIMNADGTVNREATNLKMIMMAQRSPLQR